jgi:4-hydroxy-2-oxoheptanedioate aldolase
MLYPPRGNRSVGGSVHALNFNATAAEYFAKADDELLVILQCEHIKAVEDADAIFSVPGIDVIFVGPNDLAASMRSKDGKPPSADATNQALKHILATCKKHGVAPGYHCMNPAEAVLRLEEGWQFLAIGSELKFMMNGTAEVLQKVGAGRGSAEMAKY